MNDGDLLFDVLDGVLDTASWRKGTVEIKYRGESAFFIKTTAHNIRTLRVTLEEIAQHLQNEGKCTVSGAELKDIIDNLFDEYKLEIQRSKLPERS